MKNVSKLLALILALAMVLGMSAAVWADGPENLDSDTDKYTIKVNNGREGEDYRAFKVFDVTLSDPVNGVTGKGFSYSIDSDGDGTWAWGVLTDGLTADSNGVYTSDTYGLKFTPTAKDATVYTVESTGMDETKAAALAIALNNVDKSTLTPAGVITDYVASTNDTMVVAKLGYYFLDTTLGSLCSLDTTNQDVTVQEKNLETTQDKTVQEDSWATAEGDKTTAYGDKNDAEFGQTVYFKSVVTISAHQKTVVYHDIMQTDKLALNDASITVEGVPDGKYTVLKVGEYPTTPAAEAAKYNGDTFAVQFDDAWTQSLGTPTTVTITYSATLTSSAIVGTQSGLAMDAGNDNKSSVTYGDAQRTTWDWTRTYTWAYDIVKYTTDIVKAKSEYADAAAAETAGFVLNPKSTGDDDYWAKALADAKFKFYNEDKSKVATFDSAGKFTGWETASDTAGTELTTPANGKITLKGLDADTYTLAETAAPEGYNALDADVTVVLASNTNTAANQGTDGTKQTDGTVTLNSSADLTLNVENNSGMELPSTGGIGTTIFYVIGAILVVGAGILLISRKKVGKGE